MVFFIFNLLISAVLGYMCSDRIIAVLADHDAVNIGIISLSVSVYTVCTLCGLQYNVGAVMILNHKKMTYFMDTCYRLPI